MSFNEKKKKNILKEIQNLFKLRHSCVLIGCDFENRDKTLCKVCEKISEKKIVTNS